MERVVPQYVSRSVPVPLSSRVPWYKSTFPTYAGIFLWVGFYLKIAEPTIGYADISVCLWGLLVAGLLCFGLYYYVPAMLGMQTGHPLYVVGTSTFGTTGGYLIPGLMMGAAPDRLGGGGRRGFRRLHHERTESNIQNSIQRHCHRMDLQSRLGSDQRHSLRRSCRQVS